MNCHSKHITSHALVTTNRNIEKLKMEKKTTGLSLAEAHASGRKYRREEEAFPSSYMRYRLTDPISVAAAICTYELEPEAKLLTREDVEGAYYAAWKGKHLAGEHMPDFLDKLFGPKEDV